MSRYKVDARQLLSPVTAVSMGRGGNLGLSPRQLLSNEQRINANPDSYRDVTSLLILLSVLGKVVCPVLLKGTESLKFFE